jgi:hypothetical protein
MSDFPPPIFFEPQLGARVVYAKWYVDMMKEAQPEAAMRVGTIKEFLYDGSGRILVEWDGLGIRYVPTRNLRKAP